MQQPQCITAITAYSTTLRLGSGQAQANPLGIANVYAKPKINAHKSATDGYTRPLPVMEFEIKTLHSTILTQAR